MWPIACGSILLAHTYRNFETFLKHQLYLRTGANECGVGVGVGGLVGESSEDIRMPFLPLGPATNKLHPFETHPQSSSAYGCN